MSHIRIIADAVQSNEAREMISLSLTVRDGSLAVGVDCANLVAISSRTSSSGRKVVCIL